MFSDTDSGALPNDAFYRALVSRDARFDGRFFVGVKSTGIYCRPICPAPNPKPTNCEFVRSAAEAEARGFRPCKRCRPEAAPYSPAWSGTSTTVRRALRLIGDGALDECSLEGLSDRLGITARHLRRLFDKHLGVSPLTVAATRRLHVARQLLAETPLTITDVGVAAGFKSLRRFNGAFKAAYGVPPSAFRNRSECSHAELTPSIAVGLSYRQPFDWTVMRGFLQQRAVPGVEHCAGSTYRRSLVVDGTEGVVSVSANADRAELTAEIRLANVCSVLPIVERVRNLLDVDADMLRIDAALGADEKLAPVVDQAPGLRVPGAWDPFELTVRAVLGQQVSVTAARTLAGRLCRRFGRPLEHLRSDDLTCLFPSADALADAHIETIGVPARRAETIRVLARSVATGSVDLSSCVGLDALKTQLLEIPGIGPWTVGYVRMRAFKDPDAFPVGDVALLRAAQRHGIASDRKGLERAAERWRPWRAYAVVRLWHSLVLGSERGRSSRS